NAAIGVFASSNWKRIVADTHFHVVGLTRENRDGSILRLPPEAADRTVVGDHVGMSADPQRGLLGFVCVLVGPDCRVLNALDQAQSEKLQWNTKRDVMVPDRFVEIRLRQRASRRVAPSLQREQAVNPSVTRSIRVEFEAHLPEWTVWLLE